MANMAFSFDTYAVEMSFDTLLHELQNKMFFNQIRYKTFLRFCSLLPTSFTNLVI